MTTLDAADTYAGHPDLGVSLDDGVLSVTFNRPDSLNSLTAPMLSTLADALDLPVIAQGVENSAQVDALAAHGYQFAQGPFFGVPQPADAFGR